MSRIIIITNPSDDIPTQYLDSWSRELIETAKKEKDTSIFELREKEANRKKLTELIQEKKPQLIIFNGHGTSESIMGFSTEVLIKCDDNEALLKNLMVHSLSCNSGKKLGPRCIKIGTLAYIGYSEKFKFAHMDKKTPREQVQDDVAKLFFEPAFKAILSLIQGKTAQEAYNNAQKAYAENIQICLASTSTDYNTTVASMLFHDFKYQVCLGTPSTSL